MIKKKFFLQKAESLTALGFLQKEFF